MSRKKVIKKSWTVVFKYKDSEDIKAFTYTNENDAKEVYNTLKECEGTPLYDAQENEVGKTEFEFCYLSAGKVMERISE